MEDSIETDFHNICWFCGDSPCEWVKWGEEIKQQGILFKNTNSTTENSKIRKCLYR